ncbi:hypothetical protein LTR37_001448 [Vermiconidia calcicola]|uniref:Uncharacterized protein n=1 Tax=Vermiconidia calcicola TaxID=1690605 RepID=A0ACC3NVW6_9PEZI|nr:hypothetical protein LTR37_001448 [Vermiconidia calcicola]
MSSSPPSLPWEVIFMIFNHLLLGMEPLRLVTNYEDPGHQAGDAVYPFFACKVLEAVLARILRNKTFSATVGQGHPEHESMMDVEPAYHPYVQHISIKMEEPVENLTNRRMAYFRRYLRATMRTLPALMSIHVSFFGDPTIVGLTNLSSMLPRLQPQRAMAVAIHSLQLDAANRCKVTIAMTDETTSSSDRVSEMRRGAASKDDLVQLMVDNVRTEFGITPEDPAPDGLDWLRDSQLAEGERQLQNKKRTRTPPGYRRR